MKRFILAPLPAILIGSAAMYQNNVPVAIWIQNIAGFVTGVVLLLLISRKPGITESVFIIPVSLLLLLLTFIDRGSEGVHRWVSVGPFRLYMASIVLPLLIAGLSKIMKTIDRRIPTGIAICVSFLLALQPDASQTTAFVIPTAVILFVSSRKNIVRYGVLGIFAVIVVLLWAYPDDLPPVSYVEGIMKMVAGMGVLWLISGILSLVLLPLPFFLRSEGNDKLLSISMGIYYTVVLLSPLFGNFPFPFMGYGISPIIGYYVGGACLVGSGSGKVDLSASSSYF